MYRLKERSNERKPSRPNDALPPECTVYILLGGALPSSATELKALLICLAVISIVTFPLTAALNALVIMAVKTKSRMRAIKSNIPLACLATTDLIVGVIVQPMFTVVMITIVRGETTTKTCTLHKVALLLTTGLCDTSSCPPCLNKWEKISSHEAHFLVQYRTNHKCSFASLFCIGVVIFPYSAHSCYF